MKRRLAAAVEFPAGLIPQGDFVRAAGLTGVRRLIARRGGDWKSVLADSGIAPSALDEPDRFIRYSAVIELLEECAETFSLPHFGLELAEMQTADVLGPLSVMLSASETLGEALQIAARYLYVHCPGANTFLGVEGGEAILNFRVNDPRLAFRRQVNELSIALAFHLLKMLAGGEFRPDEVHIAADSPRGGSGRIERFFGAPVHYDHDVTSLLFPIKMRAKRVATQNKNLLRISEAYLQSMSYTADNDVEQIVDQLIVELLPLGDCSLESVAKRLCCHPRTLQNRLAARNLEFREMLARQRFRLAQAYLTTTSTQLVEVAARLGYADQASFTRAFTGWCGQSPRRFRMTGKVRVLQN